MLGGPKFSSVILSLSAVETSSNSKSENKELVRSSDRAAPYSLPQCQGCTTLEDTTLKLRKALGSRPSPSIKYQSF